jgi:hypothetical protein
MSSLWYAATCRGLGKLCLIAHFDCPYNILCRDIRLVAGVIT